MKFDVACPTVADFNKACEGGGLPYRLSAERGGGAYHLSASVSDKVLNTFTGTEEAAVHNAQTFIGGMIHGGWKPGSRIWRGIRKGLRRLMSLLDSYGIPNEETVALPCLCMLLLMHQAEVGNIGRDTAIHLSTAAFALSGLWLGLCWRTHYFVKTVIRLILISVIIAAGHAVQKKGIHGVDAYASFAVWIATTLHLGGAFYFATLIGGVARTVALQTEEQENVVRRRRAWMASKLSPIVTAIVMAVVGVVAAAAAQWALYYSSGFDPLAKAFLWGPD